MCEFRRLLIEVGEEKYDLREIFLPIFSVGLLKSIKMEYFFNPNFDNYMKNLAQVLNTGQYPNRILFY